MKQLALIVATISTLLAYLANEVNIRALSTDGIQLRDNETVITADDISYIRPAINFIECGQLRDNSPGMGAFLARSPGYSFIIAVLGKIFGTQNILFALKIVQLCLFFITVLLLFYCSFYVLGSKRWSLLLTALYGATGISSGFVYYSLTEGVTPMLVILYSFLLLRAGKTENRKQKLTNYIGASLVFSIALFTRPVLGIIGLAIPVSIYFDFRDKPKKLAYMIIITGIVSASLITAWQIRCFSIIGGYTGLYPIYYTENSNSCFRPTHQAFWELCKSWGEEGSRFHGYMVPFWTKAIQGEDASVEINNIIKAFPKEVIDHFGEVRITDVLQDYEKSIHHQRYYFDNQLPMPKEIPEMEAKTIKKLKGMTAEFRHNHWLLHNIAAPLKVYKNLAFHSNLSLYIFQRSFRGHVLMELLRTLCFTVHSGVFVLLFFALFMKMNVTQKTIVAMVPVLYILYLIYFQRGIEERYSLPVLSLVFISSGSVLKLLVEKCYGIFNRKP